MVIRQHSLLYQFQNTKELQSINSNIMVSSSFIENKQQDFSLKAPSFGHLARETPSMNCVWSNFILATYDQSKWICSQPNGIDQSHFLAFIRCISQSLSLTTGDRCHMRVVSLPWEGCTEWTQFQRTYLGHRKSWHGTHLSKQRAATAWYLRRR